MSKQTVDELVEERLTEEATRVFDKALGDAEKAVESNPILKEIETKETWGDGSLYKGLEEIISHGALSEHMREIKSNFINKYVNDRKDFLIRQILNNLQ